MNDTRLLQASEMIAAAQSILRELSDELPRKGEHYDWVSAAMEICDIAHDAIRQASLR